MKLQFKKMTLEFKGLNIFGLVITTKKELKNIKLTGEDITLVR